MNAKKITVFDYSCPHQYLIDIWEQKKAQNPSYSLRAWAQSMGFSSNSTLTFLLNRTRTFTKRQAIKIIENLKMSEAEADYFEAIVDYSQSNGEIADQYYQRKISRLKRARVENSL
jgi:uncharacterized protein (TIGR02147 family)